ncbi:MAG: beta-xylosidase [Acidimicrobiia bacterium]
MRTVALRTCLLAVVVVLSACNLTPGTGGPPATTGATVAARAGISAGPDILWETSATRNADLDAIAASGATWINLDVDWKSIQGDGPTSYRWDRGLDTAVRDIAAHHLSIIGTIAYSPSWARGADCPASETTGHCYPADPTAYATFAGKAAQRYGSQSTDPTYRDTITTWQIWNEPNHQEFAQPKPDLDKYTAMLKGAYTRIKAADPRAYVITGGTAPAPNEPDGTEYTPETWLRGLYARGAQGYFDAVGHHPYMFPVNPLEAHSWNAFTQTGVLHDVMAANGDGSKTVWGTEMGAPTGTDTTEPHVLTESQQAQWVHDYYYGWNTTFRSFTGPMIWMSIRDFSPDLSNKWDNLGLLRNDGSPKPAYGEFQRITRDGL